MKSYDDLQRFKEKTQTNNIKFKDMSEQTLESDTTNWAIIKQLLNDKHSDSALGQGQSIDVIQPQPIAKDQFASSKPAHQVVKSLVAAPSVSSQGGSLFDSIAATLKPAAEPQPETPAVAVEPTPLPALGALGAALSAFPEPATAAIPPAAAAPAQSENATRYKQLFNSRAGSPAASVTKESLLKPLLEKIALCR